MTVIDYPAWLDYQQEDGLRDIDIALTRLLFSKYPHTDELVLRLTAIVSYQLQFGNPALDIDDFLQSPRQYCPPAWQKDGKYAVEFNGVSTEDYVRLLGQAEFIDNGLSTCPYVLTANKLYLKRYWLAAENIRSGIGRLVSKQIDNDTINEKYVSQVLELLFGKSDDVDVNWQKIACTTALLNDFTIITGGPGTGKTTTVVKLLALLQSIFISQDGNETLKIALAAPTGKAAARLSESIGGALSQLKTDVAADLADIVEHIPVEVSTLHGMLGSRVNSRYFKHSRTNPLAVDVLVIDEASMMDIEMFDAVIDALPLNCRMILLGDKDQLASVEAGAVLGELCADAEKGLYSKKHQQTIYKLSGELIPDAMTSVNGSQLHNSVVMLRKSYRFNANSGIGKFAEAVNNAKLGAIGHIMASAKYDDLNFVYPAAGSWAWLSNFNKSYAKLFKLLDELRPAISDGAELWDKYASEILKEHGSLQILCAVHKGHWGTKNINKLVENYLNKESLIPSGTDNWYAGRPVMVLRNRPDLGLANGDIGVTLLVPDRNTGNLVTRVAFADYQDSKIRWFAPVRLPEVETVYALTVHKSQGSEFDHAVFVMPDTYSAVLTRELLYTGITRAKKRLTMVLPEGDKFLKQAVNMPTRRSNAIFFN